VSFVGNVLLGLVALAWAAMALRGLLALLALRRLPPLPADTVPPRVSVVIAARDEQARIETTVRRLLAQQGVELEVIVVDDRSRDDTGAIVRRLAEGDARLRLVRVDAVPAEWLGKCNACQAGGEQAKGDWLLFTDADTWLRPDVVARAVAAAQAAEAAHVSMIPHVGRSTFPGKVCQLVFTIAFAIRGAAANRDRPGAHLGIGAFNLVLADAYRAIGGHEPLRMEIADDVKLGLLLRRAGRRSRIFLGSDDVENDWCASLRGMLRDLAKNHFAMTGFRPWRVVLATLFFPFLWGGAVAGPWTGEVAGIAAGFSLLALAVPGCVAARMQRWPLAAGLLVPLGILIVPISLVNSMVVTLRQGGVRWRDTFYPLEKLRAGRVR
jgi:glycosyltransferase involved in cell wall biosynthesis